MFKEDTKDIIGKILFLISIGILIYMFFSPLSQIIIHTDEYFTIGTIRLSFLDSMAITANDVHPPMYYIILKIITKILSTFGLKYDLFYTLKVTSILPYLFILIISALKLKKEYSWLTIGLFTFALGTMCDFFIHFLTIRMYGWGLLFLFLSFIFYKDLIRKFDKRSWAGLTIFTLLGAYTQYFFSIPGIILYLILLGYILKTNKKQLKNWIISVASMIILYLPWAPTMIAQVNKVHENFWIEPINSNTIINALSYYSVFKPSFEIEIISIAVLLIFLIIFFKDMKNYEKIENFYILTGFTLFFGTILLLAILSVTFRPVLILRYIIPVCSILWLSIAILVGRIRNNKILALLIIALLLLSSISFYNVMDFTDQKYDSGMKEKKALNTIKNDNGSIVIISGHGTLLQFGKDVQNSEVYFLKSDGPDLRDSINYTIIEKEDISEIINNNTDKNIYGIAYKSPLDDYIIKKIGKTGNLKLGVIHYKD